MSDSARQSSDTSGTSLNVSLPSEMRAFVDDAVAREHFGSASEFIRELIRRAQRARDKEELELELLESLGSGAGINADAKFWKRKRARVEKRHGAKRRKAP
ncbi:MAG: type II toxin-antitoxin system ParD family antitoxin [Planctomycetes bacterium]|nr:type II toxin-antitoxin system ParD family antitoxin [Planctomycetota bacterium]